MPCARPALLEYRSVRDLYLAFQNIFLGGATGPIPNIVMSPCGHEIHIYDHHFFHMVKLEDLNKPKATLLMAEEMPTILGADTGFGPYTHDKQRALHLPVAALTLSEPDEIWENPELTSAKWVYFKEFNQKPYTHSNIP